LKQFVHREEMRLRDETVEESLHVEVVEEGRAVTKTLMVDRRKISGRSGSLRRELKGWKTDLIG
jgi:hypothetical protein